MTWKSDGNKSKPHYRFDKDISFTVGVLLINGNKILSQKRDDIRTINLPGYWVPPGGQPSKDEIPLETAKREFAEETGYRLKNPKLFLITKRPEHKFVKEYFFYEKYDNEQIITCLEGEKLEFKSIPELKKLNMFPFHLTVFKKAMRLTDHEEI